MPELCRFYGIIIRMYYADHNPAHFHAYYGDHGALVSIETFALLSGRLPARAQGLVAEWAALRQQELRVAWMRAQNAEETGKIEPLP